MMDVAREAADFGLWLAPATAAPIAKKITCRKNRPIISRTMSLPNGSSLLKHPVEAGCGGEVESGHAEDSLHRAGNLVEDH